MTTKGQWTKMLIPRVRPWTERKWGESDFYVTQFISGHGAFMSYLWNHRRRNSATCMYCPEDDTVEHTLFDCPQWITDRRSSGLEENRNNPSAVVENILSDKESWNNFVKFCTSVLKRKMADEPQRNER